MLRESKITPFAQRIEPSCYCIFHVWRHSSNITGPTCVPDSASEFHKSTGGEWDSDTCEHTLPICFVPKASDFLKYFELKITSSNILNEKRVGQRSQVVL